MGSPAVGARQLLLNANVGAMPVDDSTVWPIHVSRRMEKPDAQIVCFDAPGESSNPKWLLDEPHVEVMVRGPKDDYPTAYNKAKEVKDALLGLTPQDVNGDWWAGVLILGDITPLGYDEQNRPLFSINFKLFVEPATSALTNREAL